MSNDGGVGSALKPSNHAVVHDNNKVNHKVEHGTSFYYTKNSLIDRHCGVILRLPANETNVGGRVM